MNFSIKKDGIFIGAGVKAEAGEKKTRSCRSRSKMDRLRNTAYALPGGWLISPPHACLIENQLTKPWSGAGGGSDHVLCAPRGGRHRHRSSLHGQDPRLPQAYNGPQAGFLYVYLNTNWLLIETVDMSIDTVLCMVLGYATRLLFTLDMIFF